MACRLPLTALAGPREQDTASESRQTTARATSPGVLRPARRHARKQPRRTFGVGATTM